MKILNPIINPILFAITYFYRRLMKQKKYNNPAELAYSKSTLPKITYINLDGFVDPFQINMIKSFKTIQYISLLDDDILGQ